MLVQIPLAGFNACSDPAILFSIQIPSKGKHIHINIHVCAYVCNKSLGLEYSHSNMCNNPKLEAMRSPLMQSR